MEIIYNQALSSDFFTKDTIAVARALLGCVLVHKTDAGATSGIIVETEAYLHNDPSCHAFKGMTKRNHAMFGSPGKAYVYFTYGMHYCFNIVTAPAGTGEAVLIRALEPLTGLELMRQRRNRQQKKELCSGPAKLTQAMGISLEQNEQELTKGNLILLTGEKKGKIITTTRIGVTKGADLLLRFYIADNRYISRK